MKKIIIVALTILITTFSLNGLLGLNSNILKSGPTFALAQSDLSIDSVVSVTPTPTISAADAQNIGPDTFPSGINPLTGLAVNDSNLLKVPPALVSIANFPISARPQAGLSSAPFVFEMYIGEGMTRFLALFYGDFPGSIISSNNQNTKTSLDNSQIGPIRSGRLPYESVRKLYNGFVVMASAYRAVSAQLSSTTNIYGSDKDDINSALIDVSKLEAIAQAASKSNHSFNLTGNQYSMITPPGGKKADRLWVFYNFLNQVDWKYDPSSQVYLRSQDNADGSGKFTPSTDRLTGNQLAFENVILLYAKHKVLNSERTLIDVELLYTGNKGFLFRDGNIYPIYWSTLNGDYEKSTGLMRPIRFTDRNGNPISLKPGHTFVEIMDTTASLQEIQPGSWKARFYAP